MPWWTKYDAFFYAYKSQGQIGPGSASLLEFVANVYPRTKWRELGADAGIPSREYSNLILVGHSEGGVLIRKAILRQAQLHTSRKPALVAKRIREDGVLGAYVRLFAPAYWGALLSGYKGLLLRTPIIGDLVQPLLQTSAAYKQLQATSPLLNDLRNRTVELATQYPKVRGFRALNLFGGDDDIVSSDSLSTDPPAQYERGHSHRSICKPTRRYLRPLTFVRHDD